MKLIAEWWSPIAVIGLLIVGSVAYFNMNAAATHRDVLPNTSKPHITNSIEASFKCDGGKTVSATFENSSEKNIKLRLSDGRELSLPQTISGSGARYANPDESFVFWNKGNTAFITESGSYTYSGCIALQSRR